MEQYGNRQKGQTFVLKETPEIVNHNDKSLEQWIEKLTPIHEELIQKYGGNTVSKAESGTGGNIDLEAEAETDF